MDIDTAYDIITAPPTLNYTDEAKYTHEQLLEAVTWTAEASRDASRKAELTSKQFPHALFRRLARIHDIEETEEQVLRAIGNLCADNDDARAQVTQLGLKCFHQRLGHSGQNVQLTLRVLYNICRDCEPAQLQAFEFEIDRYFISAFYNGHAFDDDLTLALEMLLWTTSQAPHCKTRPFELDDATDVLTCVRKMPSTDVDNMALLVETCLVYLREPRIQKLLIEWKRTYLAWNVLETVEARRSSAVSGTEDLDTLAACTASLTWCLSDMAARPEFAATYTPADYWIRHLVRILHCETAREYSLPALGDKPWLSHPIVGTPLTQAAACYVLGNLLWQTTEDYTSLVTLDALHKPLLRKCASSSSHDFLYAAPGLLLHLCRPSRELRELIAGFDLAHSTMKRLCAFDHVLQVQQAWRKLLRVLVGGSAVNAARFRDIGEMLRKADNGSDGKSKEAA